MKSQKSKVIRQKLRSAGAGFFPINYQLSTINCSRGFTILFAVLISSVMLAVGIAIFNITIRELRLSSIVRDSEQAIYAADSGAECALYHAFKLGLFSPTATNSWICNGQTIVGIGGHGYADDPSGNPDNANATSTVTVNYGTRCAVVYIAQHIINLSTGQVRTIIESHGYNPCNANSPSRVERVYRITF